MVTRDRKNIRIDSGKRKYALEKYHKYAPDFFKIKHDYGKTTSRKKILIICEGEKSEPNYLEWLKFEWRVQAEIEIIGKCGDPLHVVERAVKEKQNRRGIEKPDLIFAVFDKDDFPMARIENAYKIAKKHSINIVFSNESFELWYLLHFDYIEAALDRNSVCDKIGARIGRKYDKNDDKIFTEISKMICKAVKNAFKLERLNGTSRENPYTSMHRLIIEFASSSTMPPDIEKIIKEILDCVHI